MFKWPTPPPHPVGDDVETLRVELSRMVDYAHSLDNELRTLRSIVRDLHERQQPTYTVTNATTDRAYDADATSVEELADVVATLLLDLNKRSA